MLRWRQWLSIALPLAVATAAVVTALTGGADFGLAALVRPQDGVPFWF